MHLLLGILNHESKLWTGDFPLLALRNDTYLLDILSFKDVYTQRPPNVLAQT